MVFEVKKTLKKFFRGLEKDDLVNWFTLGNVETKVSPQDLITEEEFRKMLDACLNSRDRAFLSLLYETGARIGEIASMRIKDVLFDEYGAVIWLPKSKNPEKEAQSCLLHEVPERVALRSPSQGESGSPSVGKTHREEPIRSDAVQGLPDTAQEGCEEGRDQEEDLSAPLQAHPGDEDPHRDHGISRSEVHGLGSGKQDGRSLSSSHGSGC
ncbi:MAG TPA: tyrosine-type recombinase/integrase [Methermicoccus shengliensis]|uniref:Tyrosine-type recombinase/integrase n=1 Tax=Methermicoccus shengliensis TaxID=660064 RepID=A0A832RSI3_9EURY|nr:tyrosine-type recombinase/integrase [Methermicoccus shengliensis]HIH69355.1 tyrosine-type recombinase/integrase [Methermicoccus shengliensis]